MSGRTLRYSPAGVQQHLDVEMLLPRVQEVEEERPASKTRGKVDKQKFVHLS